MALGWSVRQVYEMDADEFADWLAFEQLEPFGGIAHDYRAGLAAAAVYNVNRKKGTDPVKPLDLIPWAHEPRDPAEDSMAIKSAMRQLVRQADDKKRG